MTDSISTKNSIIAKFDDLEYRSGFGASKFVCPGYYTKKDELKAMVSAASLKYHTDLSELFRVVSKIESLGFKTNLSFNFGEYSFYIGGEGQSFTIFDSKREKAMWECIFLFCSWYNNKKK